MKIIRLYTAGKRPVLMNAFQRLQKYLAGRGDLRLAFETIDVLDDPLAAGRDQVFATPTIVRAFPPTARMVGDIQDAALVARTLGLTKPSDAQEI